MAEVASAPPASEQTVRGGRTIVRLWREGTSASRANPAYLVESNGEWSTVSWDEAARRVDDLAFGLLDLGIRKGDVVAIIGRTTLEWAVIDFALSLVGAVSAAIYPTSSGPDCRYLLDHSEAVAAFVEGDDERGRVEGCGALPRLRRTVTFGELGELEQAGRALRERDPEALARAEAAVDEEDPFTYIYTSGTTGPPKACVIRHRNYYEMASVVDRIEAFVTEDDMMLLWLPLAHNFGRLMHLLGPHAGFTIAFCPDPYAVAEAMPAVQPTVLPSSPRLFEKVYSTISAQFDSATGAKRKLISWALSVGNRVSRLKREHQPIPATLALQHRIADRLVYSKVKARLGGRLRFAISGAAPLGTDIAEFFHALDILILEGYGLTECTTACSVNREHAYRFGTVGPALPGAELRIADDGEILIRSETIFAGYLKDEQATRDMLGDDGWLHSGDIGELDADGFLTITDRKKDILVTAGGKNVAPLNIEQQLKRAPLVAHAVVIGDRRPFLTALVTLDEAECAKWAGEHGAEADVAALAHDDRVRAEIQSTVDELNAERARFEQIKGFAILERDFTLEHEEVTPTMKLRRRVVENHFADEISALYP